MTLKHTIETILKIQARPHLLPGTRSVWVNIVLKNGNIIIPQFKIIDFSKEVIIGITRTEEYSSMKENRKAVLSHFKLDEIKSIEQIDSLVLPA